MSRLLACLPLLIAPVALAAPAPASRQPSLPVPKSFAGWTETGAVTATPDAAGAAAMQEYGLARYAAAGYALSSNRVTLRVWQFRDATGAYGAFTFIREPQMHAADLGNGGAADGNRYLFWTGATVVDATFSRASAGEQAALSAFAAQLPKASGGEGVPPPLPNYLPAAGLDASSVHYAIGPAGWAKSGSALSADQIDFSQDAEAIAAHYGPQGAEETLTLVIYPTPEMAGAHLKAIAPLPGILTKRSGPLLAVAAGPMPPQKAKQLLDSVRFDDMVTINHPEGYVSEGAKLYRLLFGITMLTVILVSASLLLGLFLGGGRALIRVLRGKPVSSVSEEEFISLHLGG